ncbi:MAG TPA: glucosamine-6-phosphate deaminase, partial [Ruminococcaceae bacterium]|nr:glucosamine-6-phosphate deaminase [Oscillospiraceae bacterium]HBQ46588.1 glucosamine-6-phosphate deaminase [Oscillospiraceae bacterium]
MKIIEATDYKDMSRKAANIISAQVILFPRSVLGLATGSTPLGIYQQLIDWYRKGDIDFSEVTSVNLDEYCGLAPDNPQSYHHYMKENFFRHVNIRPEKTFVPNGLAKDFDE